jgi:hypothetical protein
MRSEMRIVSGLLARMLLLPQIASATGVETAAAPPALTHRQPHQPSKGPLGVRHVDLHVANPIVFLNTSDEHRTADPACCTRGLSGSPKAPVRDAQGECQGHPGARVLGVARSRSAGDPA